MRDFKFGNAAMGAFPDIPFCGPNDRLQQRGNQIRLKAVVRSSRLSGYTKFSLAIRFSEFPKIEAKKLMAVAQVELFALVCWDIAEFLHIYKRW